MNLQEIKLYAERVAGEWDGNESGKGEERAEVANQILTSVEYLQSLLDELENI